MVTLVTDSLSIALFTTCYFMFSFGLFTYGTIKWLKFRRHFLITKRFPVITNAIITTCVIAELSLISTRWINYSSMVIQKNNGISIIFSCPDICSFIITTLLCYRLLLIYFRCNKTQKNTAKLSTFLQSSPDTKESHTKSAIYLSIYVIFCCTFIVMAHINAKFSYFMSITWASVILFCTVLIAALQCKHVKDGISCLHETYLTIVYVSFCLIMNSFQSDIVKVSLLSYVNTITLPIQGLLPLYFSLYIVYKCQASLNSNFILPRQQNNLYELHNNNNTDYAINFDSKISLFKFLTTKENYTLFASYSAYCFGLENILFVQTVSIYYQLIHTEFITNNDHYGKKITRLKFQYLHPTHNGLRLQISKICAKMEFDSEARDMLYTICKSIYDEFIRPGSLNEINISFESRQIYQFLFEEQENKNKFMCYEDFAFVFDNAMVEIYKLLVSMYSYSFGKYLKQEIVTARNEIINKFGNDIGTIICSYLPLIIDKNDNII
eukprot:359578_1